MLCRLTRVQAHTGGQSAEVLPKRSAVNHILYFFAPFLHGALIRCVIEASGVSAVPSPEVSKVRVTYISEPMFQTSIRRRAGALSRCGSRLTRAQTSRAGFSWGGAAWGTGASSTPSLSKPNKGFCSARVSIMRGMRSARCAYGPHPPPPWFDFGRSLNDLMLLPRAAPPPPGVAEEG